jgi:hypothetical protein
MITGHFTETVEIVRASSRTTDRYGNRVPDWSTASRTVTFAWLEPATGKENTTGRDSQEWEWIMLCPASVELTGRDRVIYGGTTFEVVGPPAIRRTPRGPHHMEARLRYVEG